MRFRFPLWRKAKQPQHDVVENRPKPDPAPNKFAYGLKTLYEPENPIVDIVFVHGLTGHRDKTWSAQGADKSWPEALLPRKLSQARILTFGYDANVTDWKALVSKNKIENHSKNLLAALAEKREDDKDASRPIIFVAHSLGGLVCEDALVWSQGSAEKHIKQILECTRGILFLGTPHSGSGFAIAAEALARWIGLFKQTNAHILQVLRTDSEVLARVQAGFHNMVRARANDSDHSIAITCFYEELPLVGVGEVVPMHSAILPAYTSIGIHSNHMNMTKFEVEDDPGFVSVLGELRRWVKNLSTAETAKEAADLAGQTSPAKTGSDTSHRGYSNVVTHNGNNTGKAKVVYGGNMTTISSGSVNSAS